MSEEVMEELSLTAHEIRMVDKIVDAVAKRMATQCSPCTMDLKKFQEMQAAVPFHIPAEENYNQYYRLMRFMDMIDEASGVTRKVLIAVIVGAIISAVFAGAVLKIRTL